MKKDFIIIFILVSCIHAFHESGELPEFNLNPASMNLSHSLHSDDIYDFVVNDYNPKHTSLWVIDESSQFLPEENYNPIWKPPVIF